METNANVLLKFIVKTYLHIYIYIYIYNHKANADRRKILSTRVLPNCIEPLLVGIKLQFAASKTPAHPTEPTAQYIYIYISFGYANYIQKLM